VKGSWKQGRYDVEIIFQNKLIAFSSFQVGHAFIEGLNYVSYPDGILSIDSEQEKAKKASRNTISALNALIGLKSIKKQIHNHTKYIKFLQLRREKGFDEKESILLHCIFKGNPGTGKTTVARLLGNIYHNVGILEKGHVHEVSRVDLVGEYIGQTAPKVKDAIEKSRGGVLFIDEAYALARSNEDSKDFGREVIELLIKEMSHPKCDFMVIAAGYTEEMETFIASNPGLASRFKYYYDFPDYEYDQLVEIMDYFCKRIEVDLSQSARENLLNTLQEEYRVRKKNFGNARFVQNLLEKAKINMGIRLMSENKKVLMDSDLRTILLKDVINIGSLSKKSRDSYEIDEAALAIALGKLNALIGMDNVKKKLLDLVDVVRYRVQSGELINGSFNLHTVLTGNPGTGKTTVTRICADIFKSLGILSRGHIVETDRQGLVAGFVGQTAIKTAKIIKESLGGLLFIDEAYALHRGNSSNDFGGEAIQVLIKQMEDQRGEFFVFVAGYPKEMDDFIKMNPGLKSRFDLFLHFDDFTTDELLQIAKSFFQSRRYKVSSEGYNLLKIQLSDEDMKKDKQFGNARRVRMYVDEIIRQQNLRISTLPQMQSDNFNTLIKKVDVQNAIEALGTDEFYKRKTIKF
jgi:SpoVK/Ycf46/Vps4 family AAA+-type ATPase